MEGMNIEKWSLAVRVMITGPGSARFEEENPLSWRKE